MRPSARCAGAMSITTKLPAATEASRTPCTSSVSRRSPATSSKVSPGDDAERCAHPRRRFADRSREIGPARGAGAAKPRVSDQIHPEQRHLLAGRRHEREALDARRERERRLEPRQLAVGGLRNAADLGDLVARRSLQRFERRSERPHGGFARKVHRHDHGDPQRHRRHRQQRPQRVRDQRTHDEAVQHDAPRHGGFHGGQSRHRAGRRGMSAATGRSPGSADVPPGARVSRAQARFDPPGHRRPTGSAGVPLGARASRPLEQSWAAGPRRKWWACGPLAGGTPALPAARSGSGSITTMTAPQ